MRGEQRDATLAPEVQTGIAAREAEVDAKGMWVRSATVNDKVWTWRVARSNGDRIEIPTDL